MASDIWQKLFQKDPFDSDAGMKFRKECLSHGGSKPGSEIIFDLLGQTVDPTKLCDSLLNQIDENQDTISKIGSLN